MHTKIATTIRNLNDHPPSCSSDEKLVRGKIAKRSRAWNRNSEKVILRTAEIPKHALPEGSSREDSLWYSAHSRKSTESARGLRVNIITKAESTKPSCRNT